MKKSDKKAFGEYNLPDEDDLPMYSIEDEDEGNSEKESPEEYSSGSEEEANNDPEDQATGSSRPHALMLLLRMMINPVEGWKRIRRSRLTTEETAKECFYPLLGIAALSSFADCLWKSSISLSMATISAVKIVVAFFFGNFLILSLIKLLFPRSHSEIADTRFGKEYVMYNLSTLALFYILYEILPMIGPILVFLPIWTIYLAIQGARFFMLPIEKASLLRTLLCVFIIGAPIAIYAILDLFL